MATMLRLYVDY